jgi:ankyrin repeat protein
VLRPKVLEDILESWPFFDIQDNSGKSPLDYAASYGVVESIKVLLKNGLHQINTQHLGFLDVARAWRHWNVITETLAFLRANGCFSESFLQDQIDQLVAAYLHRSYQSRSEDFKILVDLGANPHLIFENGDTLLHRLWHEKQVDALFEVGYHYVDHPNLEGQTALMASISRYDCVLYNSILTQGCDVNHRDNHGLSALHMACRKINLSGSTYSDPSFLLNRVSKAMVLIAKLLHHGADPLIHDNCRCPCSPDGCSPSTKVLLPWLPRDSTGSVWILE